jgi:hypothetical protein
MKTPYYKVVPIGVDEEKKTLYFVMVPTHQNPRPGRERQAFSPASDEAAKRMVAKISGGYTFVPPCEGGWVKPDGSLQDEPMRPFLFTAKSREEADRIADALCIHYKQTSVMVGIWAQETQIRYRRELRWVHKGRKHK